MKVEEFDNGRVSLITGDIQAVDWAAFPAVQMIFTSPPYWNKRLYGHQSRDEELGQEKTPGEFVARLADILTALPLRDDGTCFVNIGDSFIGGKGMSGCGSDEKQKTRKNKGETITPSHNCAGGGKGAMKLGDDMREMRKLNLRPKCKAAVPERLILAMIERGWIYRNKLIWAKLNCLPHSAQDRQNENFEEILMFVKSARYKYDKYGVKVPLSEESIKREKYPVDRDYKGTRSGLSGAARVEKTIDRAKLPRKQRQEKYKPGGEYHSNVGIHSAAVRNGEKQVGRDYAPLNSVWPLSTARHSSKVGEHIAPFPSELPRRAIMLATDKDDVVLDPFAGSGTTAAMAYLTGRRAIAVDIDGRLPDFFRERVGSLFSGGGGGMV